MQFSHYSTFIVGAKVGFTFSAGFPMVRVQVAKRFADLGGFSVLDSLLQAPSAEWPGGATLLFILKIFEAHEVRYFLPC